MKIINITKIANAIGYLGQYANKIKACVVI